MKAYRLLVHDNRSAKPIELAAVMGGDSRVTEFCQARLAASAQLVSIEVWSGTTRLCHLWNEARQAA